MLRFMHRGHRDHQEAGEAIAPHTDGLVLTWARRYDVLVGLLTLGREQALRQKTADLALLRPGETVLDVGCGTGTLALVARRRVGEEGRVVGIDPAPQMIARARRKAARRRLSIDFRVGAIERLPFPDQSFDVVLSSLMMHHLPNELKRAGLREIVRVLKSGGRLLVVDAIQPSGPWQSDIQDQPALMREAGFARIEAGRVHFPGLGRLGYTRGWVNEASTRDIAV